MGDALFAVRNNFYLGAFQTAISEASQLTGLSEAEKIERDVFVYRSYIELGSHEVGNSPDGGPTSYSMPCGNHPSPAELPPLHHSPCSQPDPRAGPGLPF